jgi:hypothetical protein
MNFDRISEINSKKTTLEEIPKNKGDEKEIALFSEGKPAKQAQIPN